MARDETQTKLETLQDRIYADADAELAREVREKLERFVQIVPTGTLRFEGFDGVQTAQKITCDIGRGDLFAQLADMIIDARRPTTRRRAVADFVDRVERTKVQP